MPTRRHFLALAGLTPFAFSRLLRSQTLPYALFFGAPDQDRLRRLYASDRFEALRARMNALPMDEDRARLETIRLNDHLFDIKHLQVQAPLYAFRHCMTGDEASATLAADYVRMMMRFPKWDYFLEGGTDVIGIQRASETMIAVALVADWLGEFVTPAERKTWIEALPERGCEPSFRTLYGLRYPDRVAGWSIDPTSTYLEHRPGDRQMDLSNWPRILDRTNLKAIPAGALAIGAVAVEAELGASEDTARWIEQALFSLRSFETLYTSDGSYDEGLSYANYTSQHLIKGSEVLQRAGHPGIADVINWPGHMEYATEMAMQTRDDPTGIVRFGDAGTGMRSAVAFWTARTFRDRQAQWFGDHMAHQHEPWSVIWHDPSLPATPPPSRPHLWISDLDWAVARTGYTADDLVVAMRSGPPANHEHADRNGLMIKAFGELLVEDPYRPPYGATDPSWVLRTTKGHSSVLINGEGHQYHDGSEGTNASDAHARIVRSLDRDTHALIASDATQAYQLVHPSVTGVTRTVFIHYASQTVLVADRIDASDEVTVTARYFADNRFSDAALLADDSGFSIARPNATLHGATWAMSGTETKTARLPIPEERAVQHPFVDAETTGDRVLLVTVLRPVRAGETAPVFSFDTSGDVLMWQVGETSGRLYDRGLIPEIEVV
ncbi:MAG: heparinase II/III family protein [Bacteroidota bacterium]